MKSIPLKVLFAALACLLGGAGLAPAQYQSINPYNRPRVSPYINLLRQGSSPGVNYYGLVRPEIEFRSGINQLQQQTQQNQQAITGLQSAAAGGALTTGHPVGFMTHTSYFMNLGAGGQTGFGTGLGGAAGASRQTGGAGGAAGGAGASRSSGKGGR